MTAPTPTATVLLTGGTGGLGNATAMAIAAARPELTVVLTGRDASAASAAATRISARTGGDVRGLSLDLGSLDEVRRFAKELVAASLPPLRSVVCNAGVQSVSGPAWTADGYEQTFGVNHLAHFLLVRELLPHLVAPARIVFVSSGTHDPAKRTGMPAPRYTTAAQLADPDSDVTDPGAADPGAADPGSAAALGRRRYTTSKLCNVLTTYELARRLPVERPDELITVNAFDPGLMPGTGLARDYGPVQAFVWKHVMPALTILPGLNIHTPRQSAAALARLVLDPALESATGRYFSGRHQIRSSQDSYDTAKAKELWETSLELVGTNRPTRH